MGAARPPMVTLAPASEVTGVVGVKALAVPVARPEP
jgi:hypothetical protein